MTLFQCVQQQQQHGQSCNYLTDDGATVFFTPAEKKGVVWCFFFLNKKNPDTTFRNIIQGKNDTLCVRHDFVLFSFIKYSSFSLLDIKGQKTTTATNSGQYVFLLFPSQKGHGESSTVCTLKYTRVQKKKGNFQKKKNVLFHKDHNAQDPC